MDRINCGAHKDMALEDHRSALAIQGWLPRFIEFGACSAEMAPEAVLHGLRPIGMACEGDMFRAAAGVNTHKGSIFFRAAMCGNWPFASAQPAGNANNRLFSAASFCHHMTDRELRTNNSQLTAGQRVLQQLGLTGARGEAEAGYPLVLNHALPHYLTLLDQGVDPELALLDTLLLLMAINGDTNVASRGGEGGLRWLQREARTLLQKGGIQCPADLDYLRQFDRECIERNLSPGGSADLLILTWFLAQDFNYLST
ncbi:triphosphoribosyl-dephospho-CoA synthase [Escherichia coli]